MLTLAKQWGVRVHHRALHVCKADKNNTNNLTLSDNNNSNLWVNSHGYAREVSALEGRYAGGASTHRRRLPVEEAERCCLML